MASMSTNLDIDFLGRVTADPARADLWSGLRACALLKPATVTGRPDRPDLLPPDGEVEPGRVPASAMVIRVTWSAGTAIHPVTVRKPDHGVIRYAGCLPRGTAIAAGSRSPQRGVVVIRGVVCSPGAGRRRRSCGGYRRGRRASRGPGGRRYPAGSVRRLRGRGRSGCGRPLWGARPSRCCSRSGRSRAAAPRSSMPSVSSTRRSPGCSSRWANR
jgi:hypothetical protein